MSFTYQPEGVITLRETPKDEVVLLIEKKILTDEEELRAIYENVLPSQALEQLKKNYNVRWNRRKQGPPSEELEAMIEKKRWDIANFRLKKKKNEGLTPKEVERNTKRKYTIIMPDWYIRKAIQRYKRYKGMEITPELMQKVRDHFIAMRRGEDRQEKPTLLKTKEEKKLH